ncbi:MAG: L-2-amino-thiazoline-4-carboxylic acid hydrolase, partial [Oscillospiraceae bacterium]|nr:L-2-amino-thiazoline-4-carboxylic acid hydrolase [Oscillospiraceae bacterium]
VPKADLNTTKAECNAITIRAAVMSQSSLISSYIMGIYFIAMNRHSGLSAEENYTVIETAMKNSKLFKKIMRTAEDYLDDKKMPERLKWSKESHKLRNENNWVVDVLPKCAEYDLGYDYHECGICKICRDEGCFELAKYLCRLDFTIVFSTYRHYKRTDKPNDRYS